ncbi:MAG TPA: hypothetical protein VG692_02455 [Gemmatimonadales bacterium]|nr:hypothetical protein [Gemmatimonadales bacterium]
MRTAWVGFLSALILTTGCDRPPEPASAQAPAFTPDSVRRAQLDSFLVGTPAMTDLEGGAASREALVRDFVTALEARDTTTLLSLLITRAEFGRLYYPTNPQAHPPYDLAPGLYWFMVSQHSAKGLGRALELLGGTALRYAGHSCDSTVSHEGENTVYGPCTVRLVQAAGDTSEGRLFSLLLERHGRWKFVSYANKLD